MKQLRDYQRTAIDAVYKYWTEGGESPCLISAPTGSGKSLIIATLCRELVEDYNARVLILTHVKELIEQDHDEILELWPECPIGIFSAGIGRKEIKAQVLAAGIQSIDKHAHKLDPVPNVVIIDEAHLISREESGRYKKTLALLKMMNPKVKCLGLTATPYRLDTGWLHKGKDPFFTDIVYTIDIQSLIDQGYLSNITSKSGSLTIDTSGVKKLGKEFSSGELEKRAMEGDTTENAINDVIIKASSRNKWLFFTCGVNHAIQVKECLDTHGITCEIITGDTPKAQRQVFIQHYRLGTIRALININVLSTGFNIPEIDCIIFLRPSESPSFYVQAVGRGMRKAVGKEDCLVLDYGGITLRHGPIDAVDPDYIPGKGDGVAPAKECPDCGCIIHASYRHCPHCGYEFPKVEKKLEKSHLEVALLKSQIEPIMWEVDSTMYEVYQKEGRSDMVKITYRSGLKSINEFVFPDVQNNRQMFYYSTRCKEIGIDWPYPKNASEFVDVPKKSPVKIWTIPDGKYLKVVRREY